MNYKTNVKILFFLLLLGSTLPIQAYVGPGMGGGVIAAIVGIIGSIFVAIFAIVYYPIKRALRRMKDKKDKNYNGN